MAFVDEIKIHAQAGDGGNGVVRWRHEKFIPKGGPAGGNGGRGGDFYVRAVRDIGILARYQAKKEFEAGRGEDGGKRSLHGKSGENFFLELPIGSVITNLKTDEKCQLLKEGEEMLLLRGGYGGYGNEHFKSSTNTTPKEWHPGEKGEAGDFLIEVELFADLGLVGMPNAGKSSLLNALTSAGAKTGEYPFTTLEPNLGNFYGHIIADIPGLIEGASEGKGLGIKFLRHIKRTRMLAHLVSYENSNMMKTYKGIRKELEEYGESLSSKKEVIILTKSDIAEDPKLIEKKEKEFKKLGKEVFSVTLFDDESVKNVSENLSKLLEGK